MRALALAGAVLFYSTAVIAQSSDYVEVTATKIEEDALEVPGSVTVITHEDLERLGARDLRTALALAGGISMASGGDGGPAASIPEVWGLREADAFLLIVDGVPSGGAFVPQTETLDLENVERIEVLRGSAPVVYGATAFSGVIHIIHRQENGGEAEVHGGSYGSGGLSARLNGFSAGIDREKLRAGRTGFDRGRLGWHGQTQAAGGVLRFDAGALRLQQDPATPHPREGATLSPRFAIDTNINPTGAHIDETRLQGSVAYDRPAFGGAWTTTLSLAHSDASVLRGFVENLDARTATGFAQSRTLLDLYFDTHIARPLTKNLRLLAGADYLGGNSHAVSNTFDYSFDQLNVLDPVEDGITLRDRRDFVAVYAQSEWTPLAGWRVDTGLRLNRTRERKGGNSDTNTRPSGFLGVSHQIATATWLFGDYRNTFKPAVIDFGPEDATDILRPETSSSFEAGVKHSDDRLFWQATAFVMDMKNLVIPREQEGQPSLGNGGQQRFKGAEIESSLRMSERVRIHGSYSYHDSRFRDYEQDFDGVPAQLRGKRLELAARNLASAGVTFGSGRLTGALVGSYLGSRYLNRRNTALAPGFTSVDAGIGYRNAWGEVRLDGRNLTNRRDPVAESEFGDAQYYIMPARSFRVTYRRAF